MDRGRLLLLPLADQDSRPRRDQACWLAAPARASRSAHRNYPLVWLWAHRRVWLLWVWALGWHWGQVMAWLWEMGQVMVWWLQLATTLAWG